MKKRIIQTTLALTALVTSFLPQKAEARCFAHCAWGSCSGDICFCAWKIPVCIIA